MLDRIGYSPLTANLRLTQRCSGKCLSCNFSSRQDAPELSTAEWKKVIQSLKAGGLLHLNFTGGDIFLRKDLYELLHYAIQLGFQVKCAVNGLTVNRRRNSH
ncbi:MAG: radical SAM protein [Chloroflexi bacterium]|nr:radical SAM protein [Chloroflexota bacterium]